MKHYPRCQCKAKMKPVFQGTYDPSEFKRDSRGRPVKLKRRSEYRLTLKCRRNSCQSLLVFSGPNKSRVHHGVNKIRQEQRDARLKTIG